MRPVIAPLAAALMGAGVLLAAPAASAQTGTAQPPPAAAANISDQKLDQTAAAMQKVTELQRSYSAKIASASPSDKERLASEGNAALKKAVTDHGLSVDEYNSILTVAQNDPNVRAKLLQRLHPSAQ